MCESGDRFLLHDNAPSHNATIIKQFLTQQKVTVFDHPSYSPDLAPADYFLFRKVKSHLKGRLFASISDIQKAVTRTLNTTAKDDFYKGIQKLYDRANVKSHLKGRLFASILDIQKAMTSTLNTTAKDDFYKGIQKLYGCANLCVRLEGMYVKN